MIMKETIGKVLCVGFIVAGLSYGCHQTVEADKHRREWNAKSSMEFWKNSAEKGSPCDCSKSKAP